MIANQGGGKLEIVIFLFPIDTKNSVVLADCKVLKKQAEIRIESGDNIDSMKASNDAAKSLVEAIDEWEKTVINRQRSNGQNVLQSPPKLDFYLSALLVTADSAMHGLTQGMRDRFNDLDPSWQEDMAARDKLIAEDVANFNASAGSVIIVPPADNQ